MYILNEDAIKQGRHFNSTRDDIYRESMLVENFIREFNKLNGQSVVGIYGAAHVSFEDFEMGGQTMVSMGYQLNNIYEKRLQTNDLTIEILKTLLDEPISIEQMEVAGKVYDASYFGKVYNPKSEYSEYAEYWRLDNAYDDLKNSELTDQIGEYHHYPMLIEENQIYVVIVTMTDDTAITYYAMSDGEMEDGMLITKLIIIDE